MVQYYFRCLPFYLVEILQVIRTPIGSVLRLCPDRLPGLFSFSRDEDAHLLSSHVSVPACQRVHAPPSGSTTPPLASLPTPSCPRHGRRVELTISPPNLTPAAAMVRRGGVHQFVRHSGRIGGRGCGVSWGRSSHLSLLRLL